MIRPKVGDKVMLKNGVKGTLTYRNHDGSFDLKRDFGLKSVVRASAIERIDRVA